METREVTWERPGEATIKEGRGEEEEEEQMGMKRQVTAPVPAPTPSPAPTHSSTPTAQVEARLKAVNDLAAKLFARQAEEDEKKEVNILKNVSASKSLSDELVMIVHGR